jgi:carbon starvation protein
MAFVTMYAGYLNITLNYVPNGKVLLTSLSIAIMILILIVSISAFRRWYELLQIKERVKDIWGEMVILPIEGEACLLPVEPGKFLGTTSAEEKWMG